MFRPFEDAAEEAERGGGVALRADFPLCIDAVNA
jgi:hypothetical protein